MNTKGHCYPKSIILQAVYFKLRFTLSYRDVDEIMKMHGVQVELFYNPVLGWVQMDFKDADTKGNFNLKHYHENYGFDLEDALSKHPIKELQNESHKENLMNSLKKGNRQSATFIKNGKEVK